MEQWDYAWHGRYFISIITHGREHYFGDVIDGKMILSDIGKIAQTEWLKTPEIRPDMNLVLDEFIVMPNHFHGIIQIGKNNYNQFDNGDIVADNGCNDAMHGVSTAETGTTTESLQIKNQFAPQRKNLASIIRGFKSAVTTVARKKNIDFGWQPNSMTKSSGTRNHYMLSEDT